MAFSYPDTSTRGPEMPIGVLVRKVDKDYDKERRRDPAYKFQRRKFYEDPLNHGAYLVVGDFLPQFVIGPGDFASGQFEDVTGADIAHEQNGWPAVPGPDPMEGAIYEGEP